MDLAFDIGSYKGCFSDYLYEEGFSTIVAVDPLKKNCSQNNIYIPAVISKKTGYRTLHMNTNDAICSINEKFVTHSRFATSEYYNHENNFNGKKKAIQSITYQQLIKDFGVPDLVKIDVEGAELEIIQSIEDFPKIIGFEFHQEFKEQTDSIIEILLEKGYSAWELQEFTIHGENFMLPHKMIPFDEFKKLLESNETPSEP